MKTLDRDRIPRFCIQNIYFKYSSHHYKSYMFFLLGLTNMAEYLAGLVVSLVASTLSTICMRDLHILSKVIFIYFPH
jgi:hypothetical protein